LFPQRAVSGVSPAGEVPVGQVSSSVRSVIEFAGLDAADLGLDEERGTARVAELRGGTALPSTK
jgi:hypothetical protein